MVTVFNRIGVFMEIGCGIGSPEATSLSEALKVNSSLTQLDLWIEFIIEYDLLFIIQTLSFGTILVHQEQHHYQKH